MNRKNIRTISPQEYSAAKRYRISTNEVQLPLVRANSTRNSHASNKEVIVILSDSEDEADEAAQQQTRVIQTGGYREEDEDEEEEQLLSAVKNNIKNEKLKEEQQKKSRKEVIEILSDSEDENETVAQREHAPKINRVLPQGFNAYHQENNIAFPTNHYFHNIANSTNDTYNNSQVKAVNQQLQYNKSTLNNISKISPNDTNNNSNNNKNNVFKFNEMLQALQAIEDDLYFMKVDPYTSNFSQKCKRSHDTEDELEEQLQREFYSKRRKLGVLTWIKISTMENDLKDMEMTTDVFMNALDMTKKNTNKKKHRNIRHKRRSRRQLF